MDSDNGVDEGASMTVPFYKLFSYADAWDYTLMIVGGLAAFVHGATIPIYFIFFGRLLHALGSASASPGSLVNDVSKYCLYFVYMSCVRLVSGWLEVSLWIHTGERQAARIRVKYMKAVINQEVGFFDADTTTAQIVAGISGDIVLIQDAIGPKFLASASYGLVAHGAEGLALGTQMLDGYAHGEISQEVFAQIRTVKSYVGEQRAYKSYSETLLASRNIGKQSGLVKGLGIGFLYGSGFASFSLLLWYAGKLIQNGDTNGGSAFATILNVIWSALALGQAAPDFATIGKAKVSGYMTLKMINRKPEIVHNTDDGLKLKNFNGNIELKSIHFSYPSRPKIMVFQNLELSIPAGKVVAIVGSSGSGKSTILSLIERFYDPNSGEVQLDGHNVKTLQLKWLREQIGLVNQEPALFATTILENIRYGKDGDVFMDEIVNAASISSAHDFIEVLPAGYETQVGERGVQLSVGQKQRIAIARAMLRNPPILLLDEATSALDIESENYVQEALGQVMQGRTTVIVAHRLSTIQNADMIAVLQDGRVVEVGHHTQLVKKGGAYGTLVKLQRHTSTQYSQEGAFLREETSPQSIPVDLPVQGSFRESASQRSFSFHSNSVDMSFVPPVEPELKMQGLELGYANSSSGSKTSFKRLISLNAKEWPFGLLGALGALVAGGQLPLFALAITQALDFMYSPSPSHMNKGLTKTSFLLCGLGMLVVLAVTCEYYFSGIAGENITMRIRKMMFAAMLQNEVSWFDKNSSILLSSCLSADAPGVRTALVDRTISLLQNMGLILTAFAIAIKLQWKISVVLIATLPLLTVQMAGQVQFTKGFSGDVNKAYLRANILAGEAVSNIRTVAAFGAEDKVLTMFCKELEGPQRRAFARGQISGLGFGLSEFLLFSSYALVLWYSSKLMEKGEVNFGEVVKCFMVLTITAYGLSEALVVAPEIFKSTDTLSYVFHVLERPSHIALDGEQVDELEGAIAFRHVDFSYPTRAGVQILKDFSLDIESSKSMALVGASGSGKSSVIALIMRFYDPQEGLVMIDGRDIKQLQLMSLRRYIGLVQQEPALFSTSIYENIRYGREGATETEVMEAARAANAHSFISGLCDGYNTEVGERGVQLSGGQKQRVAIARAVLRNPTILLLDEATSALDAESEKLVQDALDRLMLGCTTVLVAHRLSTVQSADSIAVLQNGHIVEQGPHAKLLDKKGAYFQLLRLV